MNYKHAYHAGNFADVTKHVLLIQLLQMLSKKAKPFYVLDAYAGRGLYSLASIEAKKTREAVGGIQQLLKVDISQAPQAVQDYVQTITAAKQTYDKHVYPGSPWWLAQHILANPELANRAEAFESQPVEYEALKAQLYGLPIGIHHRNAFEGVPAMLPPQEKRGLIFLDPPYEQEHKDFGQLVDLLVKAYNKWQQGIYALWYPIKNREVSELFHKKMKRTGIAKQLVCELSVYPADMPMGLNGTGLLIINPPWQFDQVADDILQFLQPILAVHNEQKQAMGSASVRWLVP